MRDLHLKQTQYICAQIYKTYHHSENICDREYTVTSAVQIVMQDKSQA